jgi:feruloyl esterase
VVRALDRWVSQNVAPTTLIGTRIVSGVANRTRPLCPYPQVARYKGTGSIDDAGSFSCANP